MHELHRILLDAADGCLPDVDGVVEFTGHSFVLTDIDTDTEISEAVQMASGGAAQPDVLQSLAGRRLIRESLGLIPLGDVVFAQGRRATPRR